MKEENEEKMRERELVKGSDFFGNFFREGGERDEVGGTGGGDGGERGGRGVRGAEEIGDGEGKEPEREEIQVEKENKEKIKEEMIKAKIY